MAGTGDALQGRVRHRFHMDADMNGVIDA